MFAKILLLAATSIAAVRACTNAGEYATNPVSAPSANSWPTIGQPYTVKWNNAGQGPTVTLSLYTGCPHNCKELTDIAGGIKNTGSFTWTPSSSLQANDGYGILFINESPCMTSWTYFGLNAAGSGGNTQPNSSPAVSVVMPSSASPAAAVSSAKTPVLFSTTTTTLMETSTVYYDPASVISSAAAAHSGISTVTVTDTVTVTVIVA